MPYVCMYAYRVREGESWHFFRDNADQTWLVNLERAGHWWGTQTTHLVVEKKKKKKNQLRPNEPWVA